jgi:type II secretory pathway component PulF
MLFSPRISTKNLAALCHRTGTALEAGVDARTVWAGEAKRAAGFVARGKFRAISDGVNGGCSMRDALEPVANYFPSLFLELLHVGDQTGHLDEALKQLGNHYDYQRKLVQGFLVAMIWPLTELGLSIAIIGVLIWVMGWIGSVSGGEPIDILGFGLTGNSGLAIYVTFWGVVAIACYVLFEAMRRGLVWVRPLQRLMLKVPVVGGALQSLALARLSWSLQLTLNSGMDTRRAVGLALRAARNARFTDGARSIDGVLAEGQSLYTAFDQTGAYPRDFLDTLQVGEQSGTIVESMERISGQYRSKAETAMNVLGVFAFFASFGLIAAFIILMIFRLFSFYIGTINDALQM